LLVSIVPPVYKNSDSVGSAFKPVSNRVGLGATV
jgi:hypothetical protein